MRKKLYTEKWLKELCNDSTSYAQVLEKAGRLPTGGNYAILKRKLKEFGIDTSHFLGKGANKGKTFVKPLLHSFDEVCCKNSKVSQKVLRTFISRNNLINYICSMCGCDGNWQGYKISLELDHINGDNSDNRLENLRYLCPNCHATTPTYRGRNKHKCVEQYTPTT